MSGIRGSHPASFFVAVERQGIGRKLLTPELLLKAGAQIFGLHFESGSCRGTFSRASAQGGRRLFCGVYVTLHFTKSDGGFCDGSIGVKNGVVRILPSLLHQTLGRLFAIFDKAIPIAVPKFVDPFKSAENMWPQAPDEVAVGGALVIGVRQNNEERRSIDATVVSAKRNFSQRRHFSAAHLMENFPWLGLNCRVHFIRLSSRQAFQHPSRQGRIQP